MSASLEESLIEKLHHAKLFNLPTMINQVVVRFCPFLLHVLNSREPCLPVYVEDEEEGEYLYHKHVSGKQKETERGSLNLQLRMKINA